jgi:DNA-binding transcriptional regulator YiaG
MRMGLSQRKLAAKLGIDPGTIGGWESQRHKPPKIYRKLLAEIFTEMSACNINGFMRVECPHFS